MSRLKGQSVDAVMLPSHDPLPEKLLALEFYGTVSSWLDNQLSEEDR